MPKGHHLIQSARTGHALKWVVKDDDVTSVLVGASKPQQILENLKVMEGTGFSEEELKMIDEIVGV